MTLFSMERILYFWMLCFVKICSAKQGISNVQDEDTFSLPCNSGICRSAKPIKYNDVKCPIGKRVIAYNDVIRSQRVLAENCSAVHEPFWVNATAKYTTWVIYRGKYIIDAASIAQNTSVNNMTQFTDCITYCLADSGLYIGLQEDMCYCLLSDALRNKSALSYENHGELCNEGLVMYCAKRNNIQAMVVYEKDNGIYQGFGECLKCRIKSQAYESCFPRPCTEQSDKNILCKDIHGTYKGGTSEQADRLRYCEKHQLVYVDFKTFNTTPTNGLTAKDYWLNNFRGSQFSKPVQIPQDICVIGTKVGNKIELQIEDCITNKYAVCINDDNVHENTRNTVTMKSTVSTELDVPTTADTRNINVKDSPNLIIIVAAVSVFIFIFLIATVLVISYRFCKKVKSSSEHGAVYATVCKEMIHDVNAINHAIHPEVVRDIIEVDNAYDHTDFTTRPTLHETNGSNYDAVENIQLTGESIYHHTFTFKTSTNAIQVDESVYHHLTDL